MPRARHCLLALALAAAWIFSALPAFATGSVRLEYLKGTFVYDAETVSSSGVSVQSTKNVDFGGRAGSVRIYGLSGAVVVTPAGTNPTATQTNGYRIQSCSQPIEIPIFVGQKLAIIEASDASSCAAGGSVTASTTVSATAADPVYTEGSNTGQLSVDLSGYVRSLVKGTVTANLGTLNGAATATNQTNLTGSKAPGTAAANALLTGCVFTSGGVTLTTTQQAALQCDATGHVLVTGGGGGTQFAEDLAHTTGDLGTVALFVRCDTAASTSGTTGDYTIPCLDSTGRTWAHVQAAASDFADGWDVTQGAKADSVCGTSTGTCTIIALIKYLNSQAAIIAAAAADITTHQPVDAFLAAATTGGCTPYGLASAASTNSSNIKASAGTLCSVSLINTTATLYYLRFYNAASAPTCSSATNFVLTVPVPASATGAGVVVNTGSFGWAFTTGISFCLTGGGSSTDNTNAATGVYLAASYK